MFLQAERMISPNFIFISVYDFIMYKLVSSDKLESLSLWLFMSVIFKNPTIIIDVNSAPHRLLTMSSISGTNAEKSQIVLSVPTVHAIRLNALTFTICTSFSLHLGDLNIDSMSRGSMDIMAEVIKYTNTECTPKYFRSIPASKVNMIVGGV